MPTILKFNGRRKRLSYFLTWLVLVVVVTIVQLIVGAVIGGAGAGNPQAPVGAAQVLAMLVTLPLVWPFYAVGAQRLHDMGYSGWFQLLTLIPIVNLILFLIMVFAPSHAGPNRYGPLPDGPYAPAATDARFAGPAA